MKRLRQTILCLVLLNLPSYFLEYYSPLTGTILRYSVFILIGIYFVLNDRFKQVSPFVLLGGLYFIISIFVDQGSTENCLATILKYFAFVCLGTCVVIDTRRTELFYILIFGALSIIYQALFIEELSGRYSGFYLNPNAAGLASIVGYSLSIVLKNKWVSVIGQFIFSVSGLITFSRTFLLIWLIINVILLFIGYKNILKVLLSGIFFWIVISFGGGYNLNAGRMEAFSSLMKVELSDDMTQGSRVQTWSLYFEQILDSPILGNGYLSFSGKSVVNDCYDCKNQGVHNMFLMVLGESGIFVFVFFLVIYTNILVGSVRRFKLDPVILMLTTSILIYMQSDHNYFDNYLLLFFSIWLFIESKKGSEIRDQSKLYRGIHTRYE